MATARLFAGLWLGAAAICGGAAPAGASGGDTPYSQYYGTVERVIDGDTLVVQIRVWPRLTAQYAVRVRGIDAPETHRPECPAERARGAATATFLARLYPPGLTVRLDDVEPGAFSGRIVADLSRSDGDRWLSLRDEMISGGMAAAWMPGRPRTPWCELAENAAAG